MHYLRFTHSSRAYLSRWFPDSSVLITEHDLMEGQWFQQLCGRPGPWIIDVTHNPYDVDLGVPVARPDGSIELVPLPPHITVLSNRFDCYYSPQPNTRFFPLFLWMYSCRLSLWFPQIVFDCKGKKRRDMMCLNYQTRYHRTQLRRLLEPVAGRMAYSLDRSGLPGEAPFNNDVGISHPVYARYAVNIVTETVTDRPFVSEKTCKPFMAQQIPVIVGSRGINRFLTDLGLDLFPDLVPWAQWDDEENLDQRLIMVADFLKYWLVSGTVLRDYAAVVPRVKHNKQYFHSQQFQDRLLAQMPPPITP